MISYKERLNHISTFIFDIDGVITNGNVMLMQDEAVRSINTRDTYAIQYAVKKGFNVMIISGGNSPQLKLILQGLGVDEIHMKVANKLEVYEKLKDDYGLIDREIAYMGDDIPDYEIMSKAGIAACPQDAAVEIKAISHYQSLHNGGRHAVRDLIEQTLRVQGKWFHKDAFEW